jgi:RNA polymerase sigma-70 factor (ECF subfamily)
VPNPSRSTVAVLAQDPRRELSGLVRRVAQRDQAAFAALYGLLSGELDERVGALLNDPRRRTAVVHATFVELWRLAPAHAACPDPQAWMHAVAAARTREVLRRGEIPARDPWWASFEAVHDSCGHQQFHALASHPR